MDVKAKYNEVLTAFAQPGNRWATKGDLVYWGKSLGLSAEEIIADARSVGVTNRDADIWRGWREIKPRTASSVGYRSPRSVVVPPRKYRRHVRDLILGGGEGTIDCLRECSPTKDWSGRPPSVQTELFLRAVCRSDELIHIFRKDAPSCGRLGQNLRKGADWLILAKEERINGDLLVPNPFSGELGETTENKKSLIAQSCLSSYPFLLMEMDELPLPMQYAFWCGFIRSSRLSERLVSVVYSGNRSLHGLLYVGCRTLFEWQAVKNTVVELFASDENPMYRADVQAMRPRTGTRLPGVRRADNGVLQELVYLNPMARKDIQ